MKNAFTFSLAAALAAGVYFAQAYEVVESYDEAVFVLGPAFEPGPTDPDPRPETEVWDVGPDATAFLQDGVLYVRGSGVVTSIPWSVVADEVERVKIAEGITAMPQGAMDGMDNLEYVNGMAVPVFNSVAAGAVSSGGFTAIAIDPSTQTGTVTFRVKSAASLDTPSDDWTPVVATGAGVDSADATAIRVPVPASTPAGFFKVVAE